MKLVLVGRNAFAIQGPITPKVADTLQSLPGKKAKHNGELKIELTDANLAHFKIRHPEVELDNYLQDWWLESIRLEVRETVDVSNFPYKNPPWKHQRQAHEMFALAPWFALWFEMGTGKTKVTLDVAASKFMAGTIINLVILAPNGVHKQWILEQVPEHLPDCIPRAVIYVAGTTKSRDIGVDAILEKQKCLRIFAINVESMSHKSGQKRLKRILDSGPTFVVVDESSSIKGFESSRTEAVLEVSRHKNCVARACLDGTPITQGAQDMYGPLEFMSPSILNCPNWFAYKKRYLITDPRDERKIVAYQNLEDLQKRMYSCAMRVLTKDCLDLPEKLEYARYVDMTAEQEKHYEDMRLLFLHEMKDGTIVDVKDAVVRLNKLQQILGGFLITKHEDGVDPVTKKMTYRKETSIIGTGKLDATSEILSQTDQKAIVWCIFREEADLIQEHLAKKGITSTRYTGKENSAQREENKELFLRGDCNVLIATMALCRGHNMTEATLNIWYSFPNSLMQWLQANARTYRGGQTKTTTFIRLTVPKTVDERAYSRLMMKEEFATMMLDLRDVVS
jgi:hypothetical protein